MNLDGDRPRRFDWRRYFDHAATSFPKSPNVIAAGADYLRERAGNPGRGVYELSVSAAREIVATRMLAAKMFGHENPERVLFQPSATQGLNLAIFGTLQPGDHAITTSVEHNAVSRPMRKLEGQGVQVAWVAAAPDGRVDPQAIAAAKKSNTKLCVITAGSNVLGARVDLAAVRNALGPEVLIAVDGAQVAGTLPIAFMKLQLDFLAVPGHKGLGGPPGIALLLCSDRVDFAPLVEGGTGGNSEHPTTPHLFPDGYEAGTANGPGIAGLHAALDELQARDWSGSFAKKHACWRVLVDRLQAIDGLQIMSTLDPTAALPLVSFRSDRMPSADLGHQLARDFGIAVRVGLHCAPSAHQTADTLDTGLVRASIGPLHEPADAEFFVEAVKSILRQ